jgi:hypothetical protein
MTTEPTGWVHRYVSTACMHEINDGDPDQHARCRATCKTCDAPCECANQARDIARELYAVSNDPDLWERIATDPALFWLRGEEAEPGTWTPPETGGERP